MLYNIKGKKILFLHIPKTGGSSIERKINKFEVPKVRFLVGHLDYQDSIKKLGYKPDLTFTVIRNPWDWRASWYSFIRDSNNHGHQKEADQLQKMNLKDHLLWLRDGENSEFTFDSNSKSYLFRKFQGEYIKGGEDEIRILRFENLKSDFRNLMQEIGLNIHLDVHLRKSNNKNYKNYYDPEAIKIVQDLYSKDIENFKYKF